MFVILECGLYHGQKRYICMLKCGRNVDMIVRYLLTGGNVVRGNRTVMQMKSLRDYPDMSYGSNKQWNQLCE